jgi:hypothetical protein
MRKFITYGILLCITVLAHSQELVPDNIAVIPAPEQPLPFSHKQHAGTLNLPCEHCHTNPDPGIKMGFPDEGTCMTCHIALASDKASIVKLKQYVEVKEAIPWQRVYEMVAGIKWNHSRHVQAGLACQTCHGDVEEMEVMSQTKAVTSMSTCISCHQAHEANAVCETCHAWPMDINLLGVE